MPEVVIHVEPNPKRAGTGAFVRYGAYQLGRTREDLMAAGLTKRDIDWDSAPAQNLVRFGEGERSTEPVVPVAALPAPTASPRKAPARPVAAAEAPDTSHISLPVPQRPAAALGAAPVPTAGASRAGPWWEIPERVELEAGPGGQERSWTLTARLAKGVVRVRHESGDRLALARFEQAMLHGIDPDDWPMEAPTG